MTLRVHPLVQACLEGRVDRVCAIVDQIPKTSHLYEPYVAIHAAVVGLLDQSNPVRAYHRLRRALSNPGSDPQILMLLVRYASLFAVRLGLSQEARRLIRIAADVAADKVPAELGAAVMLSDAALHEAKADFERAAEVCVAALDMDLKVPSRFWACLKSHRAHYAILCHDFATAEADVKAIEAHEDYRDNLREPALALRVRLCCESGRAEQGLAILDATSQEDAGIGRPRYVALGVRLLIALGRLDEATIMLDQAENEVATLSKSTAHRLRAELALAHGDMKAVRGHARDAIEAAGSNHPAEVVASLCHLASAELGHRRTVKARQILARIDPDESKMPTQIHWSRLYLQENNLDRAVEHFQRVVALGPAYVEQACRDACELKGHDLARLQTKCVAAGGDWVAAGPVRSPSPDAERTATARRGGNSTTMRQIRSRIRSYAGLSTPVLITGQTGTGKDVVARLLHLQSARAGEFIP
ncbi:MAG: sigma 54-interacting transcriptional regulator, partial [Vicinamibacterales bacterium]|nr:sigma 54-interacting transcriptional regulator [Vicinamibacterales bacterium]